jgi:hypothetical protein
MRHNVHMEIAALILVNLLTALSMYLLFSVRFENAVKNAPKNAIMDELKDNVESTIEYINSALDLMNSKNEAHYRMLKRGDETVRRLEELLAILF